MFGLGGREIGMLILTVIMLVFAVLALLMPIFVYQIRNHARSMDKKMDMLILLIRDKS